MADLVFFFKFPSQIPKLSTFPTKTQMSLLKIPLLFIILTITSISPLCSSAKTLQQNRASSPCPFNFSSITTLIAETNPTTTNKTNQCRIISNGILFLRSKFLRSTGEFLPPPAAVKACRGSFANWIGGETQFRGLKVDSDCRSEMELAFGICEGIRTRQQFESWFPESELRELEIPCNGSLENRFSCQGCAHKSATLAESRFSPDGRQCARNYLVMYVSAFLTKHGPGHPSTAECFFRLRQSSPVAIIPPRDRHGRAHWMVAFAIFGYVSGALAVVLAVLVALVVRRKCRCSEVDSVAKVVVVKPVESCETSIDLGSEAQRSNITKFGIGEIRDATMNFSRENIIGQGCYGNVYRGTLHDGSGVAVKRFKNCSSSNYGDETFAHEVEIIASVKHVNLLALRGYCVTRSGQQSKQRIIVSDLMRNGSLYDHLFLANEEKSRLLWPTRIKIALGTARGLAYLHYGVHPAIIHRDIKASNILLDETFEPKVADFGLARFDDSQGRTHLSTMAAGTLGYVAPEYALYGRLTEKSDVYSFGVVLLELLSGRKAYELVDDDEVRLLAEWAWKLVHEGDAMNVVEEKLMGPWSGPVMERFVHVAVVCAHPVAQARPTMDQVVKILEKYCDGEEYDLACSNGEGCSGSYTSSDEIRSDRDSK